MSKKETNTLDYAKLIDDAMHFVVKSALKQVEKSGLPSNHHFFITFKTDAKGVMIGDKLKERYPEEMTIVVQHQFYDLEVDDNQFSIVLSFDGIKHNLTVPFNSLISFVDPSVKFGLQFSSVFADGEDEQNSPESKNDKKVDKLSKTSGKSKKSGASGKDSKTKVAANNVVTLDKFRNKKDKK
jgi:hypothetical protein